MADPIVLHMNRSYSPPRPTTGLMGNVQVLIGSAAGTGGRLIGRSPHRRLLILTAATGPLGHYVLLLLDVIRGARSSGRGGGGADRVAVIVMLLLGCVSRRRRDLPMRGSGDGEDVEALLVVPPADVVPLGSCRVAAGHKLADGL